jgi:molecular chaperone HscA
MLLQIHEPGQTPMPHAGEKKHAVGIDLGTTNSLIAISKSEQPEIIRDENGSALIPSTITLSESGEIIVGDLDNPHNTIRSAKRLMGLSQKDIADGSNLGFAIDAENSDKVVRIKFGEKTITPVEVSAQILKKLKATAETALSGEVTQAVITVPAYFDEAARQSTKDAAKLAGLEVLRLINEPTAAALAYGLDKGSEGTFAVYDLGGGTFDITILKMRGGVFQVLATGGDARLGGDDFDHQISGNIAANLSLTNLTNTETNQLNLIARKVKEALSNALEYKHEFEFRGEAKTYSITRAQFETLITPLVQRTIQIFESVLEDASLDAEDIKGTVLVGGSTRVPLVQEKLTELLGQKPLADIDPDKIVALGAAIQAEALTQGSENLLIDVTPLSLGLETIGGIMEVLIPRNTPIPTSAEQKFTTYEDGQTAMKIHVYQGEREMVEHCRSLAEFTLRGIPPLPAGHAIIKVKFTLDADGILTVSAEEETTHNRQTIEVKPSYGLEVSEVEAMLYQSIEHAKEDIVRKILQESRNEAAIMVKTLNGALEKDGNLIDNAYKTAIQAKIAELETAIQGTDRELIDHLAMELDKFAADFADLRVSEALKGFMSGKSVNEIDKKIN